MEQKINGRFQPGVSGNPNGRPKGSKNKFTKDMKEMIMKVVGKYMKNLDSDMAKMTPKERVQAEQAFLKFFLSTSTKQKSKVDGKIQIEVNYGNEANGDEPKMD